MWRLLILFTGLLSLTISSLNVFAQSSTAATIVERQVIVTPAPAPKEVVVAPQGYYNCFTVDAGWYKDTWVPAHRVCQYQGQTQGVAWVEGYWQCNKFTSDGTNCTNWEWMPGRWVQTLSVY